MATATLLPPEATTSTTANKILNFFHSLLLFLLNTLRRAVQSLSRIGRSSSSPSHSHTTLPSAQPDRASFATMTSTTTPPNRLQPPKVLPVLPLRPSRRSSPGKDSKENTAPSRKETGPLPELQPRAQPHKTEPTEKLTEHLAHLEIKGTNGETADAATSPSPISPAPRSLPGVLPCPPLPGFEPLTGDRAIHSGFMREALDMARLALVTNETPVGCVLVHNGKVIAKGMNATNITRNGTRHAELMAISALLSYSAQPCKPAPDAPASESRRRKRAKRRAHANKTNDATPVSPEEKWGDVDPKDGHLYPYGQKLHPSPRVDPSVIADCVLYVTVEPCVMCASLLRQLRIRKVFFGAVNDKFGGTGGVFRIHMNAGETVPMASAPSSPRLSASSDVIRPALEPRALSCNGRVDRDPSVNGNKDADLQSSKRAPNEQTYLGGHGGNVEPGYEAEGGWGRDEAVTLLRQFYVQENGRAPIPRKKEGRAARLALMLERDGHAGGPMIPALPDDETTAPTSPSSSAADPVTLVDADETGAV